MQDANVRTWTREPQVSAELLGSLRGLNHRFLDLVATWAGGWEADGASAHHADLAAQIAPLSAAQKMAVADCPYALFDLRFHDERHWANRLHLARRWNVADVSPSDEATLDFVRMALFFAWHVASTARLAAQFLLGMPAAAVTAFRAAPFDCLSGLAAAEAMHLTARWHDCPMYWNALTSAAFRPDSAELRRIQLHGLQLAAAVRLTWTAQSA